MDTGNGRGKSIRDKRHSRGKPNCLDPKQITRKSWGGKKFLTQAASRSIKEKNLNEIKGKKI